MSNLTQSVFRSLVGLPLLAVILAGLAACGGGSENAVQPPLTSYELTVAKSGAGIGTVISDPVGINCGTACNASFTTVTVVTLSATPGASQTFSGWSGDCTGSASSCVVTMDQVRSVIATFAPVAGQTNYTLTVSVSGTGTVASQPAGISCASASCSSAFSANTLVALTATPAAGQSFVGWTGACTGAASNCTVTLDQARAVGATFQTVAGSSFALSVSVSGSGSVASNPTGISCGSSCSANFAAGTAVTLTATPAAGQRFTGWGGACTGAQSTCSLQLTQVRAVQAAFAVIPPVGTSFQTPQLLESNNDFNVFNKLVAVNRNGDSIAVWEQSDGAPAGDTVKVFSRRYTASTGWQAAVQVSGLTYTTGSVTGDFPALRNGRLFLDDTGVATLLNVQFNNTFVTRRNSSTTGWGTAFNAPNTRTSQDLTSAVMDANGNISILRSGSDIESNTLPAGGAWGAWVRLDTAGSLVSENARLALSSNGTALAVWRESNPGDSNYSVKSAHYSPTTGWGTPESIETLFTNVTRGSIAVAIDAQGNGIAMWQQGNQNIVYSNIYRAGSGWQGAVELSLYGNGLGSAGIELVMTPDGRAVSAWTGSTPGEVRSSGLITMQYSPSTGWTTPVLVEPYNINRTLQVDSSGNAVLVYTPDFSTTLVQDLVTRRLSFGGQWSAASLVESGVASVGDAVFAMNPAGQGVAIWSQNDVAGRDSRKSLWSAVLR